MSAKWTGSATLGRFIHPVHAACRAFARGAAYPDILVARRLALRRRCSVTTVHVVLINATTQQVLGEVELPAEHLPEAFTVATTLHLGDLDWSVERAEPATRAEYVAARRLRLVIREIQRVDPKTILFSLPTLENALPPMLDGNSDAVRLHEDDWRQLELVTAELEPAIEAELAAIREIHAERDGVGFRRLHVRERIPDPLVGTHIAFDAVRRGRRRDLGFVAGADRPVSCPTRATIPQALSANGQSI